MSEQMPAVVDDSQPVLRLQAIRKSYNIGQPTETEVLHGIDMQVGS